MSQRVAPSLGCGYALVAVIALAGGACLVFAVSNLPLAGAGQSLPSAVWAPATIGLALLVAAWTYARVARRIVREHAEEEARRTAHPGEPWLWRREWLDPHIEADDRKGLGLLWFFTLVWNAISLPGLVHVLRESPREKAAWLILLFPLIGVILLASSVYRTARARKYGRVRFTPASLPGVIGGHLGGVIEVPTRVVPIDELRLALRCIRKITTGSGKHRRVVETVIWEGEERVPPDKFEASAGFTAIPVLFAIPRHLPATDLDVPESQILWRLTAEAETPGVDFAATFSLPVFPVGDSATAPPVSDDDTGATSFSSSLSDTPEIAPPSLLDEVTLRRAGVERLVDGWRFDARPLRGFKWGATAFLAVLCVLLAFFVRHGAHGVVWAMVVFFALITFLMVHDLWHAPRELRLLGDELIVTDSAWFRRRETRVPRADVAGIHAENSLRAGATQYHRLILVGRPVGDPPGPAHPAEPFSTRKLRHQLARAEPGQAPSLRAALATSPRSEICFAGHIPGPSVLAALRAEILARLGG